MSTPREELATILRQARIAAGYPSQADFAKAILKSRPVVTRAESSANPVPSGDVLEAWAGVTGIDLGALKDLANRVRGGNPEWFVPYAVKEAEADTIRCWSPVEVPGLLQTESYARADLSVEYYTPERLAELVKARMERKDILVRAQVTAVIDHLALQRCIGSPAIMAEQCGYLVTVVERFGVALHVVPEGTNAGLWGGLDMATRDNETTVCLTTLEDLTSAKPERVGKAMRAFERILGAAMPRAESLTFVRTMEEQWKATKGTGANPA